MSDYAYKHKWLTEEEMDDAPKALLISEIRHYKDRLWKTEAERDDLKYAIKKKERRVIYCLECDGTWYDDGFTPGCPHCALKRFNALARRYHNGYNEHMQQAFGMKEPESPLQALEEVLDEKHDIDTAGWEARLSQAEADVRLGDEMADKWKARAKKAEGEQDALKLKVDLILCEIEAVVEDWEIVSPDIILRGILEKYQA